MGFDRWAKSCFFYHEGRIHLLQLGLPGLRLSASVAGKRGGGESGTHLGPHIEAKQGRGIPRIDHVTLVSHFGG